MNIDHLPILTEIEEGQTYIDEPIYTKPAKHLVTVLANSLAEIYGYVYYIAEKITVSHGKQGDEGVREIKIRKRRDLPPEILLRYNHVKLKWMKLDNKGKLIPR